VSWNGSYRGLNLSYTTNESLPHRRNGDKHREKPTNMNTYHKYCPNVFAAKCTEEHEKGEIITLTTRYGQEHDCIVFNRIGSRDGFFFYSIVRADGFNIQELAKRKAERLQGFAYTAEHKSNQCWEASNEGKDFLSLAEPIKIGHHSEKRHRALIERNHNRMHNAVEHQKKAEEYQNRAAYWGKRSDTINLSMPESLEYYSFRLEQARERHEGLKNGTIQREHGYSLTYAKKEVNELEKTVGIAKVLWG